MNLAQKVLYNTGVQIVGRALVLVLGLISLRLTATYLGVAAFGQLAIIIALTGLVATLGDLGVTTTLAREVSKTPGDASRLGGDLLRFRIGTSIAAALLVVVLMPFLPYAHGTKLALAIALVGMIFTILGTFPVAFFQANLRLDYVAALDVLTRVLSLAVIVVVKAFDLGLYGLVALLAVVNVVICVLSFVLSRRFWQINTRADWKRSRSLIRDAVGIGIVSMIGLLHFRGDAILLSLLRPARDVGLYAIAYRFIDQAFVLPGLFIATMFPLITRALHTDSGQAERTINRTFQVLVIGAVLVTILLFTLAAPLVHIVAGSSFDPSIKPLRILSFSLLFIFVAPVFYNVLIAINRQRQLIVVGLVSLVLNVGLNLVLIPRFGFNGAASATVVSEAISLLGCFLVSRMHYDFQLNRAFILRVSLAAGCATAVIALLFGQSPWLVCAAGELVFLAAAFAFRALTGADLRLVLRRAPSGAGA